MSRSTAARCDFSDLPADSCAHCRPTPRRTSPRAATITTAAPTAPGTDWRNRAACRDADPELFFPDSGQTSRIRAAKQVCARCPVLADCLEFIAELEAQCAVHSWHGVWGGLSEQERRAARRRARKQAAAT